MYHICPTSTYRLYLIDEVPRLMNRLAADRKRVRCRISTEPSLPRARPAWVSARTDSSTCHTRHVIQAGQGVSTSAAKWVGESRGYECLPECIMLIDRVLPRMSLDQ